MLVSLFIVGEALEPAQVGAVRDAPRLSPVGPEVEVGPEVAELLGRHEDVGMRAEELAQRGGARFGRPHDEGVRER